MQNNRFVQNELPQPAGPTQEALVQAESWPIAVDGAALLDAFVEAFRRYVVLEDGAAEAVALWCLHTHAIDAFVISPRLVITSVVPRCGKTTLLDILARLVRNPITTVNATPAAIFHIVDATQPTLLIDEADTFIGKSSDFRGIINSVGTRPM